MPVSVRRSIAELELTYYLPCSARGRTIAYLGVSRTETGDFLSSEDVELLVTLSGYVGIAIDNSMLYRSLARKAEEYERLEGILGEHRRIDQRRDSGGRSGRSRGELEFADREADRNRARRTPWDASCASCCRPICAISSSGVAARRAFTISTNSCSTEAGERDATLNIAVAPLISREGDRIGRLIIFDDITDRAELERRLVQADKLSSIGLLAAGVAHEVNTPLAVISTYAQMLAKQISGDAQKAPLLEKIARQTFRASEIVNSLLNFSRTSPTEFVQRRSEQSDSRNADAGGAPVREKPASK